MWNDQAQDAVDEFREIPRDPIKSRFSRSPDQSSMVWLATLMRTRLRMMQKNASNGVAAPKQTQRNTLVAVPVEEFAVEVTFKSARRDKTRKSDG